MGVWAVLKLCPAPLPEDFPCTHVPLSKTPSLAGTGESWKAAGRAAQAGPRGAPLAAAMASPFLAAPSS